MAAERTTAVVVGAGPAGLAAALFLARAGIETLAIDKRSVDDAPFDPRATALLTPSWTALMELGLGSALEPHASALRGLTMIDVEPGTDRIRKRAPFVAEDVGHDAFGYAIGVGDLRRALLQAAQAEPLLTVRAPAEIVHLLARDDGVAIRLADGASVFAELIVAADGRDSPTRERLGVHARRIDFNQRAMAFVVAHETPHQDVSTEIHSAGGPFTLVPHAAGPDGRWRSTVVWMAPTAEARRFEATPPEAFSEIVNERSLGLLGPIEPVSPVAAWPVITLAAERLAVRRGVVLGEAAHVAPPIGAQGLNLSLTDGRVLAEQLSEARASGRPLGDHRVLASYARRRAPDVAARLVAASALNVAARGAVRPVRDMRTLGLSALYDAPFLRRAVMRFGLGR